MNLNYIDAHAHINFDAFADDREAVIADMRQEGVGAINVGVDVETSAASIELAKANNHIWASVGCHPTEVDDDFDIDLCEGLIEKEGEYIVAVGECGLDYFRSVNRGEKERQLQQQSFEAQIELALAKDLPLILHMRPQEGTMDAYKQGLEILEYYNKEHDGLRGTAHFFVGDEDIARRFLELDFYISATGVITISDTIARVFADIPADRILVETDAPFAAPEPHRGQRNQPSYVRHITTHLARLKGISAEKMANATLANTQRLFSL